MLPIFREIVTEIKRYVTDTGIAESVASRIIDVDDEPSVVRRSNVDSVPSFQLIGADCETLVHVVGPRPKITLLAEFTQAITENWQN